MGSSSLNRPGTPRLANSAEKLRLPIIIALLVLVGTLIALFTWRALAIARMQAQTRALQTQAAQTSEQITALKAQLAEQDDPATMEYLARLKLGMIKPGETKYILSEPTH